MSYTNLALAAIDSGVSCPLLTGAPKSSEVRSEWARLRSKWGCPQRLGPFWFFSGAGYQHWYGQTSSLVRLVWSTRDAAEREMAFAEWQRANPESLWVPPFLLDYATPVNPYEVPTAPPPTQSTQLPVAPPTTIPCYCWNSPGFKAAHAEAYAEVQKQCNYQSECMQRAETVNLINYRALEKGIHLCDEKYNPCCHPSGGEKSCPSDGTKPLPTNSPGRNLTTVVGVAALGLAGWAVWQRRKQARR